jgi:hypothetical protein
MTVTTMKTLSLDELWALPRTPQRNFTPDLVRDLPPPARRYLEHAIAPGTPLATAVRVRMHGEIKLKKWLPFTAVQVSRWDRGFVWRASVGMGLLTVRGHDRYIDGDGDMRWRLLGIVPVQQAHDADIARSAAGRFAAEAWMLPAALCSPDVEWSARNGAYARASFLVHGQRHAVEFSVDPQGQLLACRSRRWGNPGGGAFRDADFGGSFATEKTFGGFTLPTSLSAGWYFGSDRYADDGEFFRATIDSVEFR